MPWVRLDDHFDEHPKLAEAGPLGIALWASGLAYCNRNLTDGFIPRRVGHSLLCFDGIGIFNGMQGQDVTCEMVAGMLVDAELWELEGRDYRVHDYLEFQPSKEQVIADRTANANRQSTWRGKQRDTQGKYTVSNGVTNTVTNAYSNTAPVPVSVPKDSSSLAHEIEGEHTRKKTRVPAPPLPAQIAAFREAAGGTLLPRKATWPAIVKAVPDGAASLATWREVVTAWMCTPYSPQNINGMLDWFNNGIPKAPPRAKGSGNGNKQRRVEPGTAPGPDFEETNELRRVNDLPPLTLAQFEKIK